ncbi:hypothetical protein BDC45DRAFT_509775 [Circinella umbellata]|nr:hypothetical protein BDC45DRAFT_509775 [Circinella umbellata]
MVDSLLMVWFVDNNVFGITNNSRIFISTRNHELSIRKCFCSIGFSPGIRVSSFCFFFYIFYY